MSNNEAKQQITDHIKELRDILDGLEYDIIRAGTPENLNHARELVKRFNTQGVVTAGLIMRYLGFSGQVSVTATVGPESKGKA